MKKNYTILWCIIGMLTFLSIGLNAQTQFLIRCDDIGMCHSTNMAAKQLIESGIPFSTSVMFVCPWYQEAVDILKDHSDISVGVHLVLNAEWKHYKWSPILGQEAVTSLVDSNGFFHESEEGFLEGGYKLNEVEQELRAQIERALSTGLKIDYMDPHMGAAGATPKLRAVMEKLAKEYNLGISQYFDEIHQTLWDVEPEHKLAVLLNSLDNLRSDKINLMVIHLGLQTSEMDALIDLNNPHDPYRVSQHREAELHALMSRKFFNTIQQKNIQLITYRDAIDQYGLSAMKRPKDDSTGYE